jgi:hypothetical protein
MRRMKSFRFAIMIAALLLFVVGACSKDKAQPVKVDEAAAKRRCAKWGKLLGMAKEPLGECIAGMKKLAKQDPTKYVCGNACIDTAKGARKLMDCMAACKQSKSH